VANHSTGTVLITTSLSLMAGLSVLLIGDFLPFTYIGLLILVMIAFALICDLVFFPTFLFWLCQSPAMLRRILTVACSNFLRQLIYFIALMAQIRISLIN